MIKNQFEILLILIIVNGIIGTLLLFDSFNYDLTLSNVHEKDNWCKIWTMQNHPELYFNYWHGIWLMPIGLMFVFVLVLFRTEIGAF